MRETPVRETLARETLAAASAALGEELTDPARLAGSERSAVLRCRRPDGGTVVVKCYPPGGEGPASYTAEAAGLAFTADLEVGPQLLATDPAARLIVMSDLGDLPSLADLLLGDDGPLARAALLGWTRACAGLAVRTAGREAELDRLTAVHAPPAGAAGQQLSGWLERRIWQLPALLRELSLDPPPGLDQDLAALTLALRPGRLAVFSPGDICPDNNLLTGDNLVTGHGVRFIDFESAEYHCVFLDAAYLRMPFSSCWCVFRLPGDLADEAESVYRDTVGEVYPELADDAIWQPGLRAAAAAWTVHAMTYLLDKSVIADGLMMADGRAAPTARQLLRYRWRRLHAELAAAGELPAIASLAEGLLDATEHWQVPDLPPYPAFR